MKHRNTVITVAIIVAVLLAAYGIGMWVRHVRIEHLREKAAAENKALAEKMVTQQMPGGRRSAEDEQKRRAEIRKQRELQMEKVKAMTDEEKHKFVEEQVRSTTSASGGTRATHEPRQINTTAQPGAAPVASEPNKTTSVAR
jgi:hypothetical protein